MISSFLQFDDFWNRHFASLEASFYLRPEGLSMRREGGAYQPLYS
jgi:hypothetical protein